MNIRRYVILAAPTLINTPLQRGVGAGGTIETVKIKTVSVCVQAQHTLMRSVQWSSEEFRRAPADISRGIRLLTRDITPPSFCAQRFTTLPRTPVRGFLLKLWRIRFWLAPSGAMKAKA